MSDFRFCYISKTFSKIFGAPANGKLSVLLIYDAFLKDHNKSKFLWVSMTKTDFLFTHKPYITWLTMCYSLIEVKYKNFGITIQLFSIKSLVKILKCVRLINSEFNVPLSWPSFKTGHHHTYYLQVDVALYAMYL